MYAHYIITNTYISELYDLCNQCLPIITNTYISVLYNEMAVTLPEGRQHVLRFVGFAILALTDQEVSIAGQQSLDFLPRKYAVKPVLLLDGNVMSRARGVIFSQLEDIVSK